MLKQAEKSPVLWIYILLAASTLLVFWQVINFDFIILDDGIYVYENPRVLNGITIDNIRWALTTGYYGNWNPLTWLSYMLDRQLFGTGAAGFHLTNIILHIANTLLLFIVLKEMTNTLWQSAFVAALFALHPLHVGPVAWISSRKDVLSAFFWLLAMWVYIPYVKKPNIWRYLMVLSVFMMGIMAKPMVVTLPFVFLLLDYWPLERIRRFDWRTIYRLVLEKIPLMALAVIFSVMAFFTQRNMEALPALTTLSLKFRIYNVIISYIKYIEKMFWPQNLAVFYPFPADAVPFWHIAAYASLLLFISVLVLRLGRTKKYLPVGWFWFLGTLVPVIGIIHVGGHAMADRYVYIPLAGLFIMLAWLAPELIPKYSKRKMVLGLSAILTLTALGISAHWQAGFWKNSLTLFSRAAEATKNNWLAYTNIGAAYIELGRYDDAIEAYKQTIKFNPLRAEAYSSLGNIYCRLNRLTEAIEAYQQAIKVNPDFAPAYNNLGNAYNMSVRLDDAIEAYQQAIKIKPDYAEAYYNLGNIYGRLSHFPEAIEAYRQALKIKPDNADIRFNLAYVYFLTGDRASALAEYNTLKSLNPQLAEEFLEQINVPLR